MAKILVADDNSNIQKMVGLALKDQGIDVVAVGNGEAAVRKISDVRPDLILADVFMPVRNGYEVCKYVKDDSSLSHIPVILLVGAFDPLDEQEAQRVGADGVLKKPFVPPDPLISMVKSALSRAGVLPSEKPAAPAPLQAVDMIGARAHEVPAIASIPAYEQPREEPMEPVHRMPEPVRIDSSAPLAFGSLLEAPAKEEEEDPGQFPAGHPELATERDWRSSDEIEETEEEEEPKASWRPDTGGFGDEASMGAARDWRDTTLEDLPTRRSAREAWEPAHEKTAIVEAAEDHVSVATKESLPAPVSISKPADPAPFAGDAWRAAVSTGKNEQTTDPALVPSEEAPVVQSAYAAESTAVVDAAANHEAASSEAPTVSEEKAEAEPVQAEPAKSSLFENWFSPAPSPWDAEIKRASQLTTGWDAPGASSAPPNAAPEAASPAPAESENTSVEAAVQEAGLTSSAVEAIREEAALVTEKAASASEPATQRDSPEAKMEDLVAKVLAKMSPDVLQAVTREILKPVVEAMVRDELNSKKP